ALDDYQAHVVMRVASDVRITDDAMASIKTKGLIGEKFVEITAGGSEKVLKPGARIRDTESAVDLEQLISNFIFGKL
ncbi:MAG: MCE family protein, partial [Deltaproteobacteria bacterium]|nr:MCE family protein [Deltaproteobacteria bacterium]